jgi:hypothetical protein
MGPLDVFVRQTTEADFAGIQAMCLAIYPDSPCWSVEQLTSHISVFPDGQFVAIDRDGRLGGVVGMASSLIVLWDDYAMDTSWRDFTKNGTFTNHDPDRGRTDLRRRGHGASADAGPRRREDAVPRAA